ncbi:MAG TPA: TIM barrel protein [Candidatus Limnocylindria bacterium]|nr:TIM barrel protein [Candidatus Limnocylindria bacterium]
MAAPLRLAAAPISWGVCEVPGWGYQLPPERVLGDMARLGLRDIEAGPPGFLPDDLAAARALLTGRGLRVIASFATAVLHRPDRLDSELLFVERRARRIASLGGTILVLAAATGQDGYDAPYTLREAEWRALLAALPRVVDVAASCGLTVALHPHVGTAIESAFAIDRVLRESDVALCLDTGHVFVGGGDAVRIAREHRGRVAHVHLKDADASLAAAARERRVPYARAVAQGLFRPLGDGDARIADVLAALRAGGYAGWAVLEQDIALAQAPAAEKDPARDVERSRDFVRMRG